MTFKSPSETYMAKQENVELKVKMSEFILPTDMFYKQNKFIFMRLKLQYNLDSKRQNVFMYSVN